MRAAALLLVVVALTACGRRDAQTPSQYADRIVPSESGYVNVRRYGPDEFGVACYAMDRNLSCVKVGVQ